jgi:hypothetical protein
LINKNTKTGLVNLVMLAHCIRHKLYNYCNYIYRNKTNLKNSSISKSGVLNFGEITGDINKSNHTMIVKPYRLYYQMLVLLSPLGAITELDLLEYVRN